MGAVGWRYDNLDALFFGVRHCTQRLVAMMAIKDYDMGNFLGPIGELHKMFEPFQEHIAVRPAVRAAVPDRLWQCTNH